MKESTNELPPTVAKPAARKRGRPPKKAAEQTHIESPPPAAARAEEDADDAVTEDAAAEHVAEDDSKSPRDGSKKRAKVEEAGNPALAQDMLCTLMEKGLHCWSGANQTGNY